MNAADLLSLCKRRGFIWPSFEIYGGVAGMYDFGPLGLELKNNILSVWRDIYKTGEGFIEIDSETVNPEAVFKASGHVDEFTDLMTNCLQCREPFRADHLVKGLHPNPDILDPSQLDALFKEKDVRCPECQGQLGKVDEFNLMFKTNIGPGSSRVGYLRPETAQGIFVNYPLLYRYNRERLPLGVIQTGRGYRNEISPRQGMVRLREFNMMEVELFVDPEDKAWERFPLVAEQKIRLMPADREEIEISVAEAVRQGIIANEVLAYFVWLTSHFLARLGVDPKRLRFRQHEQDEMAHYATDCWDAEALLSYGWTEIVGIADRGCWDLSRHSQFSGVDMTHFKKFTEPREMEREALKAKYKSLGPLFKGAAKDIAAAIESKVPQDVHNGSLEINIDGKSVHISSDLFEICTIKEKLAGERVVPHVIEPSHGLDRIFYTILEHAYESRDADDYTVLHLQPELAPVKVAVFPLMTRDGLEAEAKKVHASLLSVGIPCFYDDSGSIGKRYARMDEIGTPWCVTVDYETLEEGTESYGTVTLRDRDSSAQERVAVSDLPTLIRQRLGR